MHYILYYYYFFNFTSHLIWNIVFFEFVWNTVAQLIANPWTRALCCCNVFKDDELLMLYAFFPPNRSKLVIEMRLVYNIWPLLYCLLVTNNSSIPPSSVTRARYLKHVAYNLLLKYHTPCEIIFECWNISRTRELENNMFSLRHEMLWNLFFISITLLAHVDE